MRRGLACSADIYLLSAARVQQAGNICRPRRPLLMPPRGCHAPPGVSGAVMGVEYPGPTGLFSHGGPGDLFELWLGHPVLPALCCLPPVLPPTWTVALGCRWLLSSRDTLLIHCRLSPSLGWHPGPGSPRQGLSVVPRSSPATPNPHHWPSCVYSVYQNSRKKFPFAI